MNLLLENRCCIESVAKKSMDYFEFICSIEQTCDTLRNYWVIQVVKRLTAKHQRS